VVKVLNSINTNLNSRKCVFILFFIFCKCKVLQVIDNKVNPRVLWCNKPAAVWEDALRGKRSVKNDGFGGMKEERIQLNEETLVVVAHGTKGIGHEALPKFRN
jgi:hypothetical protein